MTTTLTDPPAARPLAAVLPLLIGTLHARIALTEGSAGTATDAMDARLGRLLVERLSQVEHALLAELGAGIGADATRGSGRSAD